MADQERHVADHGWLPQEVARENAAGLAKVRATIDAGPYADTWDSLAAYQVPRWFREAKFGIFVHWGVYSVPAFGSEWYPRNMYRQGTPEFEHHVATYGSQDEFGYKDFIPRFTMDRFDARDMAALFRRAGAQFVVPVAEHHDGFAMYDEPRTRWKAPAGRPAAGRLRRTRRRGGPPVARPRSLLAPGRALVLLQRRRQVRLRRPRPRVRRPVRPGPARGDQPERGLPRGLAAAYRGDHRPLPAPGPVVRLVDRDPRLRAVPAQAGRLLLQPRGRVGTRGRHPAQAQRLPARDGRVRRRAGWPGRHPRATVAERHLGVPQLLGLDRRARLQVGPGHRRRADRRRRQERLSAAQRRAEARRHGAGGRARAARGRRRLAERQRRGDLRHRAVGGAGRGPDDGPRGFLHRPVAAALHAPRLPVHPARLPRRDLCVRDEHGLARGRHRPHHHAGQRLRGAGAGRA